MPRTLPRLKAVTLAMTCVAAVLCSAGSAAARPTFGVQGVSPNDSPAALKHRLDVAQRVERAARTFVPRGLGVVFEAQRCRHEEVVRDAGAGGDVAVGVDRDRLHRRGSDVDSDGELRHGGRH